MYNSTVIIAGAYSTICDAFKLSISACCSSSVLHSGARSHDSGGL